MPNEFSQAKLPRRPDGLTTNSCDHLCFLEVRVLTTFLTIVRCGLRGNSSTREHQNVRFSRQNSTKKHYLALGKHKSVAWGKVNLTNSYNSLHLH